MPSWWRFPQVTPIRSQNPRHQHGWGLVVRPRNGLSRAETTCLFESRRNALGDGMPPVARVLRRFSWGMPLVRESLPFAPARRRVRPQNSTEPIRSSTQAKKIYVTRFDITPRLGGRRDLRPGRRRDGDYHSESIRCLETDDGWSLVLRQAVFQRCLSIFRL